MKRIAFGGAEDSQRSGSNVQEPSNRWLPEALSVAGCSHWRKWSVMTPKVLHHRRVSWTPRLAFLALTSPLTLCGLEAFDCHAPFFRSSCLSHLKWKPAKVQSRVTRERRGHNLTERPKSSQMTRERALFHFIGIDPSLWSKRMIRQHNWSSAKLISNSAFSSPCDIKLCLFHSLCVCEHARDKLKSLLVSLRSKSVHRNYRQRQQNGRIWCSMIKNNNQRLMWMETSEVS